MGVARCVQEDVGGFQIPVQDAALVRVMHRMCDRGHQVSSPMAGFLTDP